MDSAMAGLVNEPVMEVLLWKVETAPRQTVACVWEVRTSDIVFSRKVQF
jgi:hypothetical protein